MIPYQNCEIFASVIFYLLTKIFCTVYHNYYMKPMNNSELACIPEKIEGSHEKQTEWIDKRKHEVLKVKYKCLKKLFQVYDATLTGYYPEFPLNQNSLRHSPNHVRKRRSHYQLWKTDANVDTSELDNRCTNQKTSKQTLKTEEPNAVKDDEFHGKGNKPNVNRKKHTRFQNFVHKIFAAKLCPKYNTENKGCLRSKRRRNPIKFRRVRQFQRHNLEGEAKEPNDILDYIHSVQRNCLLDTTVRQCPIPGCGMKLCGIINYNDHLNLYHFPNKKFTCTYCHEGFELDVERCKHEAEHIGVNKLNYSTSSQLSCKQENSTKIDMIASDTQTDSEVVYSSDKCKKVSFADKPYDESIGCGRPESILRKTNSKQFFSIFKKKRNYDSDEATERGSVDVGNYQSESVRNESSIINKAHNHSYPWCSEKSTNVVTKHKTSVKGNSLRCPNVQGITDNNRPFHTLESDAPAKATSIQTQWTKKAKEYGSNEVCRDTFADKPSCIISTPIREWASDETSKFRMHNDHKPTVQWETNEKLEPNHEKHFEQIAPKVEIFKCTVCSKAFEPQNNLVTHHDKDHQNYQSTIKKKPFDRPKNRQHVEFLNREAGKISVESVDNSGRCNSIVNQYESFVESNSEIDDIKSLNVHSFQRASNRNAYKWVRTNVLQA